MQTFFKIIGALTVVAGIGYAFYRLYDRKYTNEFLFKKCKCRDDEMDFYEDDYDDCDCDETVYFDDIDDEFFSSEKIDAGDFMTDEEVENQDNNDENAQF